jgi:phosphoribosyl 1,2-cyclic phosphodiesterase
MRFASLGSGSAGNSLVAKTGNTTVLLDCGFSIRETTTRLARLNLEISQLSGILVTHEHDDHIGSAFKLSARFKLPVYLTHGTLAALGDPPPETEINMIDSHTPFKIGDMQIHPYPVPHDSREPVQFVLGNGNHRLGVLTDSGISTPHIESTLSGCHALVLECNHDLDMLLKSNYPRSLKERISSRLGHLDNNTSASLLAKLDTSKLQHILAAHLSAQNNLPSLAQNALAGALNCDSSWIGVADQLEGFQWRSIS